MTRILPMLACVVAALAFSACYALPGGDGDDGFRVTEREGDPDECIRGDNRLCEGSSFPAVAAHPGRDEYLVLWSGIYTPSAGGLADRRLYGRRYDASDGRPAGPERQVTQLPPSHGRRMLAAHDPAGPGYIAAWSSPPAPTGGPALAVALDEQGGMRERHSFTARGEFIDLDTDPAGGRHLLLELVYTYDSNRPPDPLHPPLVELLARGLTGGGEPAGLRRLASDPEMALHTTDAAAAHDSRTGSYLVARLASGAADVEFELVRLGRDLEVLDGPRAVPPRGEARPVAVEIAHNPSIRATLLAWVDSQSDRSPRIVGAWVGERADAEAPFVINDEFEPTHTHVAGIRLVAAGEKFAVSWPDRNGGGARYQYVDPARPGTEPSRELFSKDPGSPGQSAMDAGPGGSVMAVWTSGIHDASGASQFGRLGKR